MPDRFPCPSNNAVGRHGPSLSVMREANEVVSAFER